MLPSQEPDSSDRSGDSARNASGSQGHAGFVPPGVEELNDRLPQFEFVGLLGAGGMGAVYKARQPKLDRFVAIKILPSALDDVYGFADRFQREAQAMARFSHPHIVAVHDFGETSAGELYIVMEYVEGANLHQLIAGGELTLDHFYGWIPQVCSALHYAHERGIIHRDIKPANILINSEGIAKVADFGLAKLTGHNQPDTALTMADISMGTPDYAAPEQLEGSREIDYRADIYALGVVMYQMLTGKLPRGAFLAPSELRPEVDSRLDDIVVRAIQADPGSRYQDASEITTHLAEVRSTPARTGPKLITGVAPERKSPASAANGGASPQTSHGAVRPKSSRRKAPLFLALAGAAAAIVVIVAVAFPATKPQTDAAVPVPPSAPASADTEAQRPTASPTAAPADADADADATPSVSPATETVASRPMASFRERMTQPGMRRRPPAGREGLDIETVGNVIFARKGPIDRDGALMSAIPAELDQVIDIRVGSAPGRDLREAPFCIALKADGTVVSWGEGLFGQTEVPATATNVTAIATGSDHVLALRADGTVVAWGWNASGQCDVPPDLRDVAAIAAGGEHSMALTKDGEVIVWGSSDYGALDVPPKLSKATAIASGYRHLMALEEDGLVVVWGDPKLDITKVPGAARNPSAIASNWSSCFVLRPDGSVFRWGIHGAGVISRDMTVTEIVTGADMVAMKAEDGRWIIRGGSDLEFPLPNVGPLISPDIRLALGREVIMALLPVKTASGAPPAELAAASFSAAPAATPGAPAEVQSEADQKLAQLEALFRKHYEEQVSAPLATRLDTLREQYLNALESDEADARAEGHQDAVRAIQAEAETIGAGGDFPEHDPDGLLPGIVSRRVILREAAAIHEAEAATVEKDLLEKYIAALTALENDFTSSGATGEALKVRQFRESLEAQ